MTNEIGFAAVLNYNFSVAAYWLRLPVQNGDPVAATFYLDVKNQLLEYVTLYLIRYGRLQATRQSGGANSCPAAPTAKRFAPMTAPGKRWQATSVNTLTPNSATAFTPIGWRPCIQGSNGSAP